MHYFQKLKIIFEVCEKNPESSIRVWSDEVILIICLTSKSCIKRRRLFLVHKGK